MFRLLLDLLRQEGGWSRVWVGLGMAITMAGGGFIYYQAQDGAPPAEDEANVWMDPSGGGAGCARHVLATYDAASDCSSVTNACNVAQAGDIVRVRAGSYGAQTTSCQETNWVTYYLDASATFSSAGPTVGGNFYMKFIGGTITTPSVDGNFVWYENNNGNWYGRSTGDNIQLDDVHDVTLIGPGDITMGSCGTNTDFWWWNSSSSDLYNIVVKGFDIHAYPICAGGDHVEIIRMQTYSAGNNIHDVTIEGNTFYDCECDTAYIFITHNAGLANPYNITVRNNFFGDEPWPRILQTNDPNVTTCDGYTIEYNSAMSGAVWANFTNCTPTNYINRANVECGTGFVDCGTELSKPDYHITSSASNAYGQGGSTCPPTDIDGESRPQGTCDAGADEIAGP